MHGRRLATLESIVALTTSETTGIVDRLETWTGARGIDLTVAEVGTELDGDWADDTGTTLAVTVGGDGTFLEGVRAVTPHGIPVLGINSGTLAFFARVDPEDAEDALTEVFRGRATVTTRQQYRVQAGEVDTTGINEVFLKKHPPEERYGTKVGSLHVFVDDEYVGEYFGSGLVVSTPTGSTGRAFSNHGPIHYPGDNRTLQVVPHETISASANPIVVSQESTVSIVPEASFDIDVDGGREFRQLDEDTVVHVTGADQPAQVVRTSYDDSFITALVDKLDWGLRSVEDRGPRGALAAEPEEPDFLTRAARVAREAAESAGEPLQELHGRVEQIEYKTDKADIVTEADYQADDIIRAAIQSEFPNHTIQSEEQENVGPTDGYSWLVDPLDGTGNFAHGNPNYSVSIALLDDDDLPVVGVVYNPESGEMFHGIAGDGAYENGRPIVPTDRARLDESMLLSGYDPDGGFLQAFYQGTQGVRRLGSAALHLAYVASGSADAVWEYDTRPWDVAAGLCILRAVDGRATDQQGTDYRLRLDAEGERTPMLASNGHLHDALLDHLATTDI
ncbi:inositol monophosphatase [Halobacteriales archaeon SW_7_68_16]|nr:MAG: inositol monophosphatase [Halobacteriales archaeon SW_7_68_16]